MSGFLIEAFDDSIETLQGKASPSSQDTRTAGKTGTPPIFQREAYAPLAGPLLN
jgi:hypothetical protein